MAQLNAEEQKDKFVAKLDVLCEEVEHLRKELSISQKRTAFLEERIEISYNAIFDTKPTTIADKHTPLG
mgnify:CR=1 FL=1